MMMGDTGAGKSVLQRRVLAQIAERGETAIVYDPALEHTPQFFKDVYKRQAEYCGWSEPTSGTHRIDKLRYQLLERVGRWNR